MEKVLSIIIPTYNMEQYLHKCVDSLIVEPELMGKFEVLVVIDGAKDGSSKIGREYQDKYPQTFKVIDKKNGNYGSCINRGLKEATGKYVKVLDADDSFNTENFSNFIKLLLEVTVDLVISDFIYKNEDDVDYERKTRALAADKVLLFNEVVADFNSNLISMHELAYKRSIFKDLNYHQTEGISYTDLEWCFLPMTRVKTIYYSKDIIYRYLIGREGQTVNSEVAARSISHKMKSGLVMTKQLADIVTDETHKSYLNNRLVWSNGSIYYNYLISCKSLLLAGLIDFDSSIKVYNGAHYEDLAKLKVNNLVPVRYIAVWRKQTNKNTRSIIIRSADSISEHLLLLKRKLKHEK